MENFPLPEVSKYYNELYRLYIMKEHRHPEDEVMYVTKGVCYVPCYDSHTGKWTDVILSEGHYIHICGGVLHNLIVKREMPCRILNVEYMMPPGYEKPLSDTAVIRDDGSLLRIMQVLHDKLRERDSAALHNTSDAEDIGLAVLLLDKKIRRQREQPQTARSQAEKYVEQAKRFIMDCYTEELSIPQIAQKIGIAPAYLQRLFHAHTGSTITEYVNGLRLNRSKYLLSHSELSLVDVAENAGFGSRQRLAQIFRKEMGISPGQYRASMKNQ